MAILGLGFITKQLTSYEKGETLESLLVDTTDGKVLAQRDKCLIREVQWYIWKRNSFYFVNLLLINVVK